MNHVRQPPRASRVSYRRHATLKPCPSQRGVSIVTRREQETCTRMVARGLGGPGVIDCRRLQRLIGAVGAVWTCEGAHVCGCGFRYCASTSAKGRGPAKRIIPREDCSDKEQVQTSDSGQAWEDVLESRLDQGEMQHRTQRRLVLLNDYCVCSVPKAINAATSEVRADSVGFSKGSRLHFTSLCMQVRSKWRFFWRGVGWGLGGALAWTGILGLTACSFRGKTRGGTSSSQYRAHPACMPLLRTSRLETEPMGRTGLCQSRCSGGNGSAIGADGC